LPADLPFHYQHYPHDLAPISVVLYYVWPFVWGIGGSPRSVLRWFGVYKCYNCSLIVWSNYYMCYLSYYYLILSLGFMLY
jgi:hypothetical protein